MERTDTELLVNCSNKATLERQVGRVSPDTGMAAVQAQEERRTMAAAYLKARIQVPNSLLTTRDLAEILALLGIE